jgi:hypothetical protein
MRRSTWSRRDLHIRKYPQAGKTASWKSNELSEKELAAYMLNKANNLKLNQDKNNGE